MRTRMYDFRCGMAFFCVAVVIFIAIPGVLSCNSGSSPVVRLCYNNNITFTSAGFATSEGLSVTSRDCACTLTTDGALTKLRVVLTSQKPSCVGSTITLGSFGSTLARKFDCDKSNTPSTLSISPLVGLNQQYTRRTDDKICMQYKISSGGGSVQISCSGDELPSAPSTSRTTTTQSTTTTSVTKNPISSSTGTRRSPQTRITLTQPPSTSTSSVANNPSTKPTDITSSKTSSTSFNTDPSVYTKTTGNGVGGVTSQSITLETSEVITSNETVSNDTTTGWSVGHYTSQLITDGSSTQGNNADKRPKNLDGIIAGVVIASIAFVTIVACLVVFLERKRRAKKNSLKLMEQEASMDNPAYSSVVNDGYTISADVNEMTTTTTSGGNNNGEAENIKKDVKENGKTDEEIGALYATVNKDKKDHILY